MRMIGFINPNLRAVENGLLASAEIEFTSAGDLDEFRANCRAAEAAVVSNSIYSADIAEALNAAPGMRWIQSTSIGVDALIASPPRPGIVVTNAAGLKARTVAEHALSLLLAVSRNLPAASDQQRNNRWANPELAPTVRSLAGKRVVCLGYGAIGRDAARKLAAFDAEVVALTRTGKGPPPAQVMGFGELSHLLPTADVVLLALPLAKETKHIINRSQIERMKPGAILINVGRGELVEEEALCNALREGKLGGAGLDVFEAEPLDASSPLWQCPRTVITPHLGGAGGDGDRLLVQLIEDNAGRLKRGEPLINVVAIR